MASPERARTGGQEEQVPSGPAISLPKGGGAIRGIGEKFSANPVTGTGSITVPIATSPGRSDFGPKLNLSYDSGAGNGPFGLGWSLNLPQISRKTEKGLPQYRDAEESDVFILSGAEDLVPVLRSDGSPWTEVHTVDAVEYQVRRYRPRVEGLFARIERWTDKAGPTNVFWRSISRDNITTWYGRNPQSRVADPADPGRVFSWLICESHDDRGNVTTYAYEAEDSNGIDTTRAHEHHRTAQSRSAQRYLKRVRYGNRTPYFAVLSANQPLTPLPTDWLFEVVLDYGEHDDAVPLPVPSATWPVRPDPFSSYRPGFEVRAYRLCQRLLMFHHFPDEPGVGENCLVRSTDLSYAYERDPSNARNPSYSRLESVTLAGYKRRPDGSYLKKSLPPLVFSYSEPAIQDILLHVGPRSLENLPVGLAGDTYQWTDLHGEGVPGILSEQGHTWFYKRNLSPLGINRSGEDGGTPAMLAPTEMVGVTPNAALEGGQARFMDLAGDGQPDLVVLDGPVPGLYEHDTDEGWQPFRPFTSPLKRSFRDPNLRLIDLDGDGHADALITEDEALVWHESLAEDGFGPAHRVTKALDEAKGPRVVFADGTQSIYLADMSGDGLTDLLRVRNGEICYWPNLGYGRFGTMVTMDHAPQFDYPDQFDQERLCLADIDGTGTTDIVYLHRDGVQVFFNQSGNSWSQPQVLRAFPRVDDPAKVAALDLRGNGTTCLVWSSLLPEDSGRQLCYVDLMGGQKPHLLTAVVNNLGAETRITYAPSTKFYLADRLAGKPWVTRLPFPVHVVERVETYDYVSRNRFVTRYAYHHGYFDGEDREFRGFGMVEQWDTEMLGVFSRGADLPAADNEDAATNVPPVLTKTWFHTGAYLGGHRISNQHVREYYGAPGPDDPAYEAKLAAYSLTELLPDTVLPSGLTPAEEREACRALKGAMLRREVYALDGTDAEPHPFTVVEQNLTVRMLQAQVPNVHAVFFTHPREVMTFHYERNPVDPRIQHVLTLEVDDFGNVYREVSIAYGRQQVEPSLPLQIDHIKQNATLMTYIENTFTNVIDLADAYRRPLRAETMTYELTGFAPENGAQQFSFDELTRDHFIALTGASEIRYEQTADTTTAQKRLIEHARRLYRPDDLGVAQDDPLALLPVGMLESLAVEGESYKLAFTPGLLGQVFRRPRSGQADEDLIPNASAVLGGLGSSGGGYVDLDVDAHWWVPSGRNFFSPGRIDTAATELAYARNHFFRVHRYRDPFHTVGAGTETVFRYDSYDLLTLETCDAVGNRITAGERLPNGDLDSAKPGHDYRVLQPRRVMDPNRNRSEIAFDALGMVVGTAVMGKPEENRGDSLDGFDTDLSEPVILDHLANPQTDPDAILGRATTRLIYDLSAYQRTMHDVHPQPARVYTLVRETHDAALGPGEHTGIQHSFSYSDGFGREIQKKLQAEPGPVPIRDSQGSIRVGADGQPELTPTDVAPRWVGSGWTVFNNKGKPVRRYEPFFTDTHHFEFDSRIGVSGVLFYDPLQRVVAALHPDHTYEKTAFNPWQRTTWDSNDTVLGDPRTDADVGGYVQGYFESMLSDPGAPAWETWYQQRQGGALGTLEQTAAAKAAAHAGTPTTVHLDTLGRPFVTAAHNRVACPNHDLDGTETMLYTRVDLDIEGNQREIRDTVEQDSDPQGRIVMRYSYDMLGNRIHHFSMEAGRRWGLSDVAGKPIRTWDSQGRTVRAEYDPLRRPLRTLVTGADPENPGHEVLTERLVYGEQHPDAEARNLHAALFMDLDQVGVLAIEANDFRGNQLRSSRRVTNGTRYRQTLDWSAVDSDHAALPPNAQLKLDSAALQAVLAPVLEQDAYTTTCTYDALNRPLTMTTPHTPAMQPNVIRPGYNEANMLERVDINLQGTSAGGEPVWTPFVTNINYNARGQRERIDYGNGANTTYEYDLATFRLVNLLTRRDAAEFPGDCPEPPPAGWPGCHVQNLHYTYDSIGNITHIRDDAQQTRYFRNMCIEPGKEYTYDACYRLLEATGREQLGQITRAPIPHSHDDALRISLPHPGDGTAVGRYTERYVHDVVGNILKMQHRSSDPTVPGWTRTYSYDEPSQIEPVKTSNLLSSTTVGGSGLPVERYVHDAHGNMTRMPHLGGIHPDQNMCWDYTDRLCRSNLGGGGTAYNVYDRAGQRVRKIWEKAPNVIEERLYLGSVELFRRYDSSGVVSLQRESLHVMDDQRRIALVETRTVDSSGTELAPPQITRYQLSDQLGSCTLELDDQAQIISYEEYTPYGSTSYQAVRSQVETPKRHRYTGKERDEESGLYYHGARYYAPWLGRWVSPDPKLLNDSTNLFVYVVNNPVISNDPTGKEFVRTVSSYREGMRQLRGLAETGEVEYALAVNQSGRYAIFRGTTRWVQLPDEYSSVAHTHVDQDAVPSQDDLSYVAERGLRRHIVLAARREGVSESVIEFDTETRLMRQINYENGRVTAIIRYDTRQSIRLGGRTFFRPISMESPAAEPARASGGPGRPVAEVEPAPARPRPPAAEPGRPAVRPRPPAARSSPAAAEPPRPGRGSASGESGVGLAVEAGVVLYFMYRARTARTARERREAQTAAILAMTGPAGMAAPLLMQVLEPVARPVVEPVARHMAERAAESGNVPPRDPLGRITYWLESLGMPTTWSMGVF